MDALPEKFSIINNDHEFIHGNVEIMDQSDVVEYLVEEAQIVEEQEEPYVYDSDEYTQTGRKRLWTKPAIKLMLCLVEDILPDVGTTSKLPTKSEMYKYVAKEMTKEGYSFTGTQVENKFRGLEKTYKRKQMKLGIVSDAIPKPSSPKIKRKSEEYEKEDSKSDAEVVWMLCDEPGASNQDQVQFKIEPNTSSRAISEPQPNVFEPTAEEDLTTINHKNGNSSRQLLRMFGKMATERRRYHSKVLAFLKAKDERGRRREERDQKKLELLERLLSQKT